MRIALALAAAAALLLQGAAAAFDPVLCTMTGLVAAGRCHCEHPGPEAGISPRCCERSALEAAPSVASPFSTLAQPALPVLAAQPPAPCAPPSPALGGPDARALSPPIPILHRSLLR